MTQNLYWADFLRTQLNGRKDTLADQAFLNLNFTDFFGQWLRTDQNSSVESFDGLLQIFWGGSQANPPLYQVNTFVIADAGFLNKKTIPNADWFSPHIRLVSIVTLAGKTPFTTNPAEWTLCIVGSADLTQTSRDSSFLQVASWDSKLLRFYQNDFINGPDGQPTTVQAWNYFGNSMDAFGPSSYLGPFNGHVNGAVIMKELHAPWIHWYGSSAGGSLPGFDSDFTACFSQKNRDDFKKAPYITQVGQAMLSAVDQNPNDLEGFIKTGVLNWFTNRQTWDFFDSQRNNLQEHPKNVDRWTAHLFLTTTINIATASQNSEGTAWIVPNDHFYDQELLSQSFISALLPGELLTITFTPDQYKSALDTVGLSMLQEDFSDPGHPWPADYIQRSWRSFSGGTGPNVGFRKVLENNEGQAAFNILQASMEDAQGVSKMQMLKKVNGSWMGLFSTKVLYAIIMLDFWNPIYSWRRGKLMEYVPPTTTLVDGKTYDLEANFITNVKNSTYCTQEQQDSPEYQFIQLLDVAIQTHQSNISKYYAAIRGRFATDPVAALIENLTLAESRRRIYRPLPLDEFGYTMPYALGIPEDAPLVEMTAAGTTTQIPERGIRFFTEWTDSLANANPHVIPDPTNGATPGLMNAKSLPRAAGLALRCQAPTSATPAPRMAFAQSCPFLASRRADEADRLDSVVETTPVPTWTDDILPMIQSPYWLPAASRASTGAGWIGAMKYWSGLQLDNYENVKDKCVTIYEHLRSRTMPVTDNPDEYWPEEALETLRSWANGGFPQVKTDAPTPQTVIPTPVQPIPAYRVRRDIMSLSADELAVYQSKLDAALDPGQLGTKWQELGLLHTEWCLHYQEATFLWHRAYLRQVEELIDYPIPYWNGYAKDSSDPDSPYAGIPAVFFEDTYKHPDGSIRPNPLKYALALDGKSKQPPNQYVTRDPILVNGKNDPGWNAKISLFTLYHQQITQSLSQATFTSSNTAEGFGMPWANIPTFSDNQPDSLYPYRFDFDGLFEQVHDNFHGWVGPDMADNTYTAFDPIFLSYHCNMDRLAAKFIESHPEGRFTSGFPLQPFQDNGKTVAYDDPRKWSYTTIGDMAKDTRALGYLFALPANPDVYSPPTAIERKMYRAPANGGKAVTLLAASNGSKDTNATNCTTTQCKTPYIIFSNVGCTSTSYRIDVFTRPAASLDPNPVTNPDFIGQITRIGMGPGRGDGGLRNATRCRKPEATRVLKADGVRERLEKGGKAEEVLQLVVTDLEKGEVVGEEVYGKLGGFEARVIWLDTTQE
ncbi:hypothetical protein BDZ85DRAFT_307780 [Elsinoe ampelina]|uniref:tyrosinase n=1 Tax=Elsinoe ampelina TaxID=302913 RepID=A0A6A6GJ82_9PEZI|nr:hypothetical protein BDZ85DRAFT_307780 [Elsinoe ampelina]